jgi:hypothetical protein
MAPRDPEKYKNDPIDQVEVKVFTGSESDAGTDGEVYLLLCGREFCIKRADINDRQPGKLDTYVLGRGANIENKARNDPQETPVYMAWNNPIGVRFAPKTDTPTTDAWHLAEMYLYIRTAGGFEDFALLEGSHWFGWHFGLTNTQFGLSIQDPEKTPNEQAKEFQSRVYQES